MKMKPILFNGDMVRALLDGRKTVTRRVVKPQPMSKLAYACMGYKHGTWGYPGADNWKYWEDESFRLPDDLSDKERNRRWTPPYRHGDILYVRETWCDPSGTGYPFLYRADMPMHWDAKDTEIGVEIELNAEDYIWRPSIHMPREAARIFLRVTDVRVERLWDITEEQAKAEGLYKGWTQTETSSMAVTAKQAFMWVWDRTIKPADRTSYGWISNPWVWVIEFERFELTPELRKEKNENLL